MYLIKLGPVTYERRGGGGFTLPEAMREVYGVGYASVLREDGTTVVSDAGSSVAVKYAPRDRVVWRQSTRWARGY
jgi:hypothetical protein